MDKQLTARDLMEITQIKNGLKNGVVARNIIFKMSQGLLNPKSTTLYNAFYLLNTPVVLMYKKVEGHPEEQQKSVLIDIALILKSIGFKDVKFEYDVKAITEKNFTLIQRQGDMVDGKHVF